MAQSAKENTELNLENHRQRKKSTKMAVIKEEMMDMDSEEVFQ